MAYPGISFLLGVGVVIVVCGLCGMALLCGWGKRYPAARIAGALLLLPLLLLLAYVVYRLLKRTW